MTICTNLNINTPLILIKKKEKTKMHTHIHNTHTHPVRSGQNKYIHFQNFSGFRNFWNFRILKLSIGIKRNIWEIMGINWKTET